MKTVILGLVILTELWMDFWELRAVIGVLCWDFKGWFEDENL